METFCEAVCNAPRESEDLAYILGVLKGDGCAYDSGRDHRCTLQLEAKNRDFVFSFSLAIGRIMGSPPIQIESLPTHHTFRICKRSPLLYDWYTNLSQSEVEKLALQYPISFMRGFYESEGSVGMYGRNGKYGLLRIVNTNSALIGLTSMIMNLLGFRHRIRTQHDKRRNRKKLFIIVMSAKQDIAAFLDLIKPVVKNQFVPKGKGA